ncbi:hypothetical protein Bbelb_287040 [Branchiostoma belcheri]|nr:hypothetical protein Bbelb_287040 [Branchiostoma belcheri]
MRRPSAKVFTLVISTRQNGRSSRLERTGRYDVITSNRCRWRQPSHLTRLVGAPGRQMRRPSARVFTLVISTRQNGRSLRLERTGRYDVITSNRCRWRQPSHLMRLVGAPGRQMRRPSAKVFTLVISTRQNGRSSRLERTGRYDVITSNRCRWRQPSHLMRLVGATGRQMRRPSARVFTLVISTRQNGRSSRLERTGRYDVITQQQVQMAPAVPPDALGRRTWATDAPTKRKSFHSCDFNSPKRALITSGADGTVQMAPAVPPDALGRRHLGDSGRDGMTSSPATGEKNSSPLLQVQMAPAVPPDALGRRTWATDAPTKRKSFHSCDFNSPKRGAHHVWSGRDGMTSSPATVQMAPAVPPDALGRRTWATDAPTKRKSFHSCDFNSPKRALITSGAGRDGMTSSPATGEKNSSPLLQVQMAPAVPPDALGRRTWATEEVFRVFRALTDRGDPVTRRLSARYKTSGLDAPTKRKSFHSCDFNSPKRALITSGADGKCRWRQPSHLMRLVGAPGRQMRRPSARVFTLVISTRQTGAHHVWSGRDGYDVITSNRCRWRQPSHLMRLVGAPGRQMRRPRARVFTLVISTRQTTGAHHVWSGRDGMTSSPAQVQMAPAVPPDALGRRTWATGMRRPSARVFTLVISTRQKRALITSGRTGRYDVITSKQVQMAASRPT